MRPVSVSQVNEYIAKKLRDDLNLRGIAVEGEISGFSMSGKHCYLTLKDADSMIKCAIWASNLPKIDMRLIENGKKIVAVCDISPYAKGGSYSLSIRYAEAAGEGDLMAEFNRIKELLEKEGLFDKKYKKPIAAFPYRVGVVTSSTGAAIEDIRKIITAKNDFTDIIIFPTTVQGIGAVRSICDNIELANRLNKDGFVIDTLIVGRGGGSPEDLAAFNDEEVCRSIFASEIPIISAVGHESDFSISDMVADVRAETPTAAAEMAVMNTFELRDAIEELKSQLVSSVQNKVEAQRELLSSRRELLLLNIRSKLNDAYASVDKAEILLRENNPGSIFAKGYAAVTDMAGAIIADVASIVNGNSYIVRMRDGSFTASASDIRKEDTDNE